MEIGYNQFGNFCHKNDENLLSWVDVQKRNQSVFKICHGIVNHLILNLRAFDCPIFPNRHLNILIVNEYGLKIIKFSKKSKQVLTMINLALRDIIDSFDARIVQHQTKLLACSDKILFSSNFNSTSIQEFLYDEQSDCLCLSVINDSFVEYQVDTIDYNTTSNTMSFRHYFMIKGVTQT